MRPFTLVEKNGRLRIASWAAFVALLFAGNVAPRTKAAPPDAAAQAVTPPGEEARERRASASPDLPVSVAGGAMPNGVAGGVVVVRTLPTSSSSRAPLAHPRGPEVSHEFLQHESGFERMRAASSSGVAAPRSPEGANPEPQLPTLVGTPRPATDFDGGPAAPGDFVQQWTGLSNTGWLSPDTTHAVGPAHVVEAVNSGFSIYTKFGTQAQGYTTFESFLNPPAVWAGFMFDPRLIYDAFHQKFVMLVLGKDELNVKSYYWLAVSQSSDPTGAWWVWRFDATATINGSVSWLDHAGLTADNWGVYVTGNYFTFNGIFRGSLLSSINPDILNGGATNGWRFVDLRWPGNQQAFALQPAHPHSASPDATTYFVNTFNGTGSQVLLWKLSGDRASFPTLTQAAIATAGYDAIGASVDQPGSAIHIYGGDARVASAVYSQGRVFYVLTDDVNNNGDSAGWLTVGLDVDSNTNEWQHLLWGGAGVYYFYPALTILGGSSPDANLAVFGNWTDTAHSPGQFASGLYKIYDARPATTGPLVSFAPGLAPYVALDSSGRNRFGSHSGAGYDWGCGHAWGSVEAADAGNTWRTVIAARQLGTEPVCPQVEVTVPNGGQVWNAGTTQTITWQSQGLGASSSIDISFDPGTGDTQVAGNLASTSSSFDWEVPGTPTSTGRIFVGSWAGGAYEASGRSDANFTITAPDLRVIDASVSGNLLMPGDSFTANATADNQGNGSSNVATTLRYYRSTDAVITTADTEVATDPIPVLGTGATSVQSAPLTAPAVGNYWIGACVDAVAGESSVTNQCSAAVPITVTRPDLISLIDAPLTATQGQTINVSNTVQNQGTIGTGVAFNVGLYLSNDATCNTSDTLLTNRAAPALGAGASHAANTSVTIPLSASVGNPRYICAVADSTNVIVETNEDNNIGTDTIQVVALVPTVNLKANGIDAVYPAAVTTTGPLLLTLDMTPGPVALDHYYAIVIGSSVFWITSVGVSTTPAPLATFTPVALTNLALVNQNWPSGTSFFVWLMLNGGTVVGQDFIQVNVTP